ncbi:hypothetical protein OFN33_30845, partial [Escherichia coli]|nr:hypothetical protein [Escherichia coli]
YSFGPNWLLPVLELALLTTLSLFTHLRPAAERIHRASAILLIAVITFANLFSLVNLALLLLHGSKATGAVLLGNALNLWFTN